MATSSEHQAWVFPSDETIRAILAERIGAQRDGVGIVVGIIGPQERRIVSFGTPALGDARPVGGDTLFEIGSVTKVFTSLALADMAEKGEVSLDDPVSKYLPAEVAVPERDGRQITLIDLATHTSALPRIPENMAPADPANPYADYTLDLLYAFLGNYTLPRAIGAEHAYSNLGAGLLGHALARRAGTDYETLIRDRITRPLQMASTAITLPPAMQARLASGHDHELKPAKNWDLPTLAGAGALRSSVNDLLTFLSAVLGETETPLRPAMTAQLTTRRQADTPELQIALGWYVLTQGDQQIVLHSGGTGGYRAFLGFDPVVRRGAVVLTNAATARGGDDIGLHLLTGSPLVPPPIQREAITLPPSELERFVGRYRLTPELIFTIKLEGTRLMAQLTGQAFHEIFPESPTRFFWKIVDAQASFQIDPEGQVSGLVLHQNGQDMPAPRISED